jgi:glycosyltransferase involved in cell wall biosynthesis
MAHPSSHPLTVVMSVYNGARFLDEAIDSIRTQSFRDFEFLIVDDGSTDESPQILVKHAAVDERIRILTQENRGLTESLNRAFGEAQSTFIARMDQDDVSRRYRLEIQMNFLSSNPGLTLVGAAIEIIDEEHRRLGIVRLPEYREEIRAHMRERGCALAHPTVLLRRDAVLQMGGFRKAYKHADDYDLWLRMLERFDFANLQDVLLEYRRHSASTSRKQATQQILSTWCAQIVAKRRLEGLADPTDEVELITPSVIRSLGFTQKQINERIFTELTSMAEASIRYGFSSAAAEFIQVAQPFAEPDWLRVTALELNRKAATAPTRQEERAKHRQALLDIAPEIFHEVFAPASLRRRVPQRALAARNDIEHSFLAARSGPSNPKVSQETNKEPVSPEARLRLLTVARDLSEALEDTSSLVSVVIRCFNSGPYIWDALSSVLTQSYAHVEIIIIDDGSVDSRTLEVLGSIRHERVRVIHQSNQGLAQTRNTGKALSRGEYVLFLDAGDRLERHAVAILLYALSKNPSVAYAYSHQRVFGDQTLISLAQHYNSYDLLWSNPSAFSLIRRSALEDAGEHKPELLYGYEDWEYLIRLSSQGHHGLLVEAPVFEHRRQATMFDLAPARKRFLHSQILIFNSDCYKPLSVTNSKRSSRPLISIVIPIHDRTTDLGASLRSLEEQTTQDFEIVLVNDGSGDLESLRLLTEIRNSVAIRVIDTNHSGPASARNRGALAANADLLLFLDSGNLLDRGAIEKLCWTLARYPQVAFVYSGAVHSGDIEALTYDDFEPQCLHRDNHLTTSCVIRREVFFELGGFDCLSKSSQEDSDFWRRLVERGHAGMLFREPLFHYRRHKEGQSTEPTLAAAAGEARLSTEAITRHTTTSHRPAPLMPEMPRDPLLARMEQALRDVILDSIPREGYRRPNVPNLFSPQRWDGGQINILYLIPSFYVGGAEVFDLRVLSCLSKDKYRVILVACEEPDGPWYDDFKALAGEIYALRRMGDDQAGHEAFLRYLMVSKSVDIVFNRNTWLGYDLAANWRSISKQVRYVDLLHLHAFGADWVGIAAKYHDKIDLRYVGTEEVRNYAVERYGLSQDPFRALYYGMSPDELPDRQTCAHRRAALREKWRISESAFVVGLIARLTDQKDPVRWLSIAAKIAEHRTDTVFLVVGDGELLSAARAHAADLGLADRVVFTGYQKDAANYCAAMDVFLLTSKYEGIPLVVLAALAHGTPMVAADVGGIREALNRDTGRLLPPDAEDGAYSDAVLEIAKICSNNASFFEDNHRWLAARFSQRSLSHQLDQDFGELVATLDRDQRRKDYILDVMARPLP